MRVAGSADAVVRRDVAVRADASLPGDDQSSMWKFALWRMVLKSALWMAFS